MSPSLRDLCRRICRSCFRAAASQCSRTGSVGALLYLGRAGLSKRVRRGVWKLTVEGEALLTGPPSRLSIRFLRENYPAYVAWRTGKTASSERGETTPTPPDDSLETPEEVLDTAVQQLSDALKAEVLNQVCEAPPSFLERVVVDLLLAMGYGGGDPAMGRVTGQSGDGGIDGTIREDALGLDEVYVQAKKYAAGNTVGEGDLRNFAGAIDAAGTTKAYLSLPRGSRTPPGTMWQGVRSALF